MDNRYQALLLKKITDWTNEWEGQSVSEADLYKFFHQIKGTAGSIGMMDISLHAAYQLQQLDEDSSRMYSRDELQHLESDLLKYFTLSHSNTPTKTSERQLILLIESDFAFATELKEQLEQEEYHVILSLTAKRGIELFYTLQPAMVFLDYHLADMNSLDVLTQIYPTARAKFIPITLLSDTYSPELHRTVLERGAMDYFRKPLDATWFISFVENRMRQKKAIQDFGLIDELTGAGNRKAMNDALASLLVKYQQTGASYTLALLDLDHFKKVNDTYGHLMGDEVLRRFGEFVRKNKRASDLFFRYGGEEFALVVPEGKETNLLSFIEKLRKLWTEEQFVPKDQPPFQVTFSAGLATFMTTPEDVLEWADQALYSAKNQGRNQTKRFADAVTSRKQLSLILVDDDEVVSELLEKAFQKWTSDDFFISWDRYDSGESLFSSDWYQEEAHHILLLDWILPGIDGIEILQKIRTDYPNQSLLISMLTAKDTTEDLQRAMRLGADDYIQKPFQTEDVVVRIQNLSNRFLTGGGKS